MANIVLIEGKSGSGKSTAIRNLNPDTTYLFRIINKPLPFQGAMGKFVEGKNQKTIYTTSFLNSNNIKQGYADASKGLCTSLNNVATKLPHVNAIVIDDSQYLMSYELMSRAREKSFDKFVEIQQNFFNVIQTAQMLPDNLTVFFLHHTDESDPNNIKAKTVGKMIDNSITLEGVFTIVLLANARKENGKISHFFITQSDGTTTAKSPMGMFDDEIENDLQLVLTKMNEYYKQELKVA